MLGSTVRGQLIDQVTVEFIVEGVRLDAPNSDEEGFETDTVRGSAFADVDKTSNGGPS